MAKKKKATTRPTRKSPKKAKPTAAGPPRADDAIRQLDAEFMKTANAKNAGALVKAFYTRDAVLMPPNHPAVEGHADIGKFLQGMIDAGFADIKLETTTIASAGDLAYGQGHYELSMTPAGGAATQDVGKYIVVYRRQPSGGWRAIADIFNSDQAAH